MNNTEHFGKLTERMQAFREEVLDAKPYIDAQRAVLATEAYKENQNQPRVMVRALMLQKILEGMSIYIDDKSLIAGNQATKNKNAPIFPEYTMEFVMNELDLFEKRDGDVFYITEETKEQLREIAPFWENNNLRARRRSFTSRRGRCLYGDRCLWNGRKIKCWRCPSGSELPENLI